MRKRTVSLIVVAALVLFGLLGGLRWVVFHTLFYEIGRQEDALKSSANANVAGPALARLCQTCKLHPDWFAGEPPFAPAWTPAILLNLHPTWVEIAPDSARVEFGGGFHHFGYQLDLDSQPGAAPNQTTWVLRFYSEDSSTRVLAPFSLSADDTLTEQQFVDQTMAELDRRIAAGRDAHIGGDIDAFPTVQRWKFALKHHEIERLLAAIRASAQRSPHDWRDNLWVFLIDHATDPTAAAEQLRHWAASDEGFSTWLLAAYAFDEAGEHDAAAEAVLKACQFSPDEPTWLSYNVRYRGFAMCRRLYDDHKYDVCGKLCDTLLAKQDNYLQTEISRIRDSCRRHETAAAPTTLPAADKGILFNPFEGVDVKAIRSGKPTTAQAATAPAAVR